LVLFGGAWRGLHAIERAYEIESDVMFSFGFAFYGLLVKISAYFG